MGAHPLIFAAVLLYSVQLGYSVPPTISFVPQSPLILTSNETQPGTGRPLAITCTQVAGGTLLTLNLYKLTTAGIRNQLMNAATGGTPDGTNGNALTAPGVTGATASGTLEQRFITLTYSQASCDSGATYICASNVLVVGDSSKLEVSFNYSVDVNPGHATLIIEGAASQSTYMVGDSAILRCNADVGAVDGNTKVDFVWQYEVQNNFAGKTFQEYPNLEDIDSTASPTYNQYCTKSQNRISVLTRNLTIEDSERQYKCYIRKGSQSYEQFAGVKAFSVVRDADAPLTPGAGSQATAKADAGMIVGIIIAILVVIAVVVVIVVFVIRRRNMKKQEGAYDPEKTEPTASAPPPYAPPEEVGYSQPRFSRGDKPRTGGHSNKAMEDEHDDKPRDKERERDKEKEREKPRDKERDKERDKPRDGRQPRYANDYNDGRQNPAYERNVDDIRGVGRRPSSDDGGTDGNRSYLSLGEGDHTIGTAI